MIDFGSLYAQVDDDVLNSAARRTQDVLQAQTLDWALCRGIWVIDGDLCIWASAWEIDWEQCQSTTEARAFINLTYESELYVENIMKRMVFAEQARLVSDWINAHMQLPLPLPIAV